MRKTILAVIALSLAFSFTTAQKQTVKQVEVKSQTIAAQPKGKSYALDLSRKGTIYNLPADADISRVRIRTAKGEVALSDLVQKTDKRGQLMVGLAVDFRGMKLNLGSPGSPGSSARYTCEGLKCKCTGDADCNDMFSAGVCGDVASCDNGNGTCECYKKVG
jgi:hypothetical protein